MPATATTTARRWRATSVSPPSICTTTAAGTRRQPLPLPQGVRCYAAAASIGRQGGDLKDRLLGDGLVPLDSALGRHREPGRALDFTEEWQWVGFGMNHMELLDRAEVYAQLHRWLARG